MFISLALSGCSSGGGGGDDDEFSSDGGIAINAASIAFAAVSDGPLPASKQYTISWTNPNIAQILVGVPPGQSLPFWLDVAVNGNSSPLALTVSVIATNLSGGTYNGTLRLVSTDINGFPLDLVDIPFALVITEELTTLTPTLDFSYVIGASALPADKFMQLEGTGIRWQASADQPWVTLASTSGVAPQNLLVSVDPTGLPVGSNTAVITAFNRDNPAQQVAIDVNFEISAPAIVLSAAALDFSLINGRVSASRSKTISFSLNNLQTTAWTAVASDPWIVLDASAWSGPDTLTVDIDEATPMLASGDYAGIITLSTTTTGGALSVDIPVNLDLDPATISAFPSPLSFRGSKASELGTQTVFLSVNTFPDAYPWSMAVSTNSGGNWLQSDLVSGTVSQVQAQPEISIDITGLVGGTYAGSLDITVQVNGDTLQESIPVELQLEDHRLYIEENGVALLSTPGISRLSHGVRISHNRDDTIPWNAISDQSWLTVTPSGLTGGDLVLTADPTSLAAETVHYANVAVSSTEASVGNVQTIRVGFYVTSTAPSSQITTTLPAFNFFSPTGLVADPIRPYVYITNRGSDIQVYNIYSGALVDTIATAGTSLRNMTISTDGQMLYALDYVDNGIVTVDLGVTPWSANPAWTDPAWSNCNCDGIDYSALEYTRIKGRGILVAGARDIIDATTGSRLYPSDNISFISQRVVSQVADDGRILFSANTNSTGHRVSRSIIDYDPLNNLISIGQTQSAGKSGFNRGLASNPDGSRVYRACWYPLNEVEIYDGSDLSDISLVTNGTNGGALFAADGLLYCARYYSDFSMTGGGDVWSVDPLTGAIVAEYNVVGEVERRLFDISGDGKRLITRSNNQSTLTMTTIP